MKNMVKTVFGSGEARKPGDMWSDDSFDYVLLGKTLWIFPRVERVEAWPLSDDQVALGNVVTMGLWLVLILVVAGDAVIIAMALRMIGG